LEQLIWLIPALPLIGFLINGIGNKAVSRGLSGMVASVSVLGSFMLSIILFTQLLSDPNLVINQKLFTWMAVGSFEVDFGFMVDRLSIIMLLVITGVGFLIHVYSTGYMHEEPDYARYFAYLNLFVFFMLLLVLGSGYLMMFVGWEGVGLCSYLLIGFWFKNPNYNAAASKAFIMNRIGDLGFLLGMFLLVQTFGSLSYDKVIDGASSMSMGTPVMTAIALLLFIGATGKSAQIPLYTWLPDAMAGPTPVSALIHAATMVTAGIYMVVRSNVIYVLAPIASELIVVVGVLTALTAAFIGLKQTDIKKVLAYSTVSQLGLMFVALGLGAYSTALFHVVTHAFFKALLFLCAGSVIHAMGGEQDIRKMGGLKKALPITHLTFLIGTLAITGIPPFAGFFSKDEILAAAFATNNWIFALVCLSALLTAIYMFRLYFLTFHGDFRGTKHQQEHLHESPASMTTPLIVLAVLSTIGGFIGMPAIFHAPHLLSGFLSPITTMATAYKDLHVSHTFEYVLIVCSLVILAVVIWYSHRRYATEKHVPVAPEQLSRVQWVLHNKFFVDEFYDAIIVRPLRMVSNLGYKWIENGFIDGIVNGLGSLATGLSGLLRYLQSGAIGFYLIAMVVSFMVIFFLKMFI
jgi:NADH-quinone oxidoreductase subunit L